MRRFIIERDIPKVGSLEREQLREAAAKSSKTLATLGNVNKTGIKFDDMGVICAGNLRRSFAEVIGVSLLLRVMEVV